MNESAFPWAIDDGQKIVGNKGMTLRDYFAANAMQGFNDRIGSQSDQRWFDEIAKGAYRMADAMLKARQA
jgi:hypothetical protein